MNEKDKPVTRPGMDTEDPLILWPPCKNVLDTRGPVWLQQMRYLANGVAGGAPYSGAGLMDRWENGNEEDAWWTDYYWTPMDYFALSSADYDGHEARLGSGRGLKKADPTHNC